MIVDEISVENENYEHFRVGMRVLAVDDDPIGLKLLETLLRKCEYNVTTTSEARTALEMLMENKDDFDLVISDVHMPDMDGFKLLELVGLEMDLPVILLSVNGDPKNIAKGVTKGACDYLVKPVRLEELRNLWQHVLRKKVHPMNPPKCIIDQGKTHQANKEEGRVVWSIELHVKFVAVVNQLGIEKAVPERILDLMKDDGLTREEVARHLEKYRVYLKRISSVTSTQQANMNNGSAEPFTNGILNLMNDDRLTQEDIANHLQKYRVYLKRISSVASTQQANMNNGSAEPFTKRILNLMNDDRLTQEDIANHLEKYRLYLKRLGSVAATQKANMISLFSVLSAFSEPDTQNKPRVVWTVELHSKFVKAIDQLCIERSVPETILDLMAYTGLT